MNAPKGWTGKMLTIDLTSKKVTTQPLPENWPRMYIGARGFGIRLLYDLTGPETDPLGPENVVIIAAGPLTGTMAPSSSRCEVVSKSPLTGIYARGDVGGTFGPIMKYAGYDIITVKGRSEKPVYIWIDDTSIEIKDATSLWGMDVWETRHKVCAQHEPDTPSNNHYLHPIGSLFIGPAGENLSMAACVMCGVAHAAGLGGLGAVWGSKNLKGVAVRGSRGIDIAEPEHLLKLCGIQWDRYHDDPLYASTRKWGTLGWVGGSDSRSTISDLMLGQRFKEIEEHAFEPIIEKNRACYGCPIHCDHFLHVKEGKYKGSKGEGLEGFVQILGMSFKTASAPFLAEWNNMCNRLGVNVSSAGVAIIWAMALWKEGIITKDDTGGIEVTEGNEDGIMELTRQIAYREGFGDILADFPVKAAQRLGRNSDRYASHTKGQFAWIFFNDTATTEIYTMSLNVNTRGYDHLMGGMSMFTPNLRAEFGITEDLLTRLGKERYNDADIFAKNAWDYHPKIVQAECDFEHMKGFSRHDGHLQVRDPVQPTGYRHQCTRVERIPLRYHGPNLYRR
jgi:aldehyde:ferredoxin oxidoreductase